MENNRMKMMKKKMLLSYLALAIVSVGYASSPDVDKYITQDDPYKAVKVVDKFGKWPEQKGDPYYSSQVGTWFTVWWTAKGARTFDFHWIQETRVKPVAAGDSRK